MFRDASRMVDMEIDHQIRRLHLNPEETTEAIRTQKAITLWNGTILSKWFMDEGKNFTYAGVVEHVEHP